MNTTPEQLCLDRFGPSVRRRPGGGVLVVLAGKRAVAGTVKL